MAGRIPEDIVDKVRDECAIEDVIGHFLPLQRKGASYWACCPFHSEKTPSFHVHPERQIFYCFGCQRGGNVFRFLMDKEGMAFPEAVQWCASRIGLDLSRFLEEEREGPDPRGPVYDANTWYAGWLEEQLQGEGGEAARRYARERGLRPETIESFGLGYAPPGHQALEEGAKKANISRETLLNAAILGRKEGQAPFAYFRSRLIFPIRGVAQKIHGFGGRILGPGEPKYLNSPETPVFKKRRTLYALPEARAEMVRTRTAILVEGYLDALALHQSGWTNCVATCGTAFATEQAKVLGRYVDRLVLLFDGDPAGLKAAFKSADVALTAGLDVRIVRLPGGKDPADLLGEGEVETLQTAIEEAPGLVECMAQEVRIRGESRELKERALHHLQSILSHVNDPIRAELLRQEAADVFAVPLHVLKRPTASVPSESAGEKPVAETGRRADLENALLTLALASRRSRQKLLEALGADDFEHERMREIYQALERIPEERDAAEIADFEEASASTHSLAARLLLEMPGEGFDAAAELETRLRFLAELSQRQQKREGRRELNRAYEEGQDWQEDLRRRTQSSQAPLDPTETDHADQRGEDEQ